MTTSRTPGKLSDLGEAIDRHVRPGDHVHLGYNDARPNAAVLQLVRNFAGRQPNLTLSTGGLVSAQASLISEEIVTRVIASFVGDNYPTAGPNSVFQRAIDRGQIEIEETTLWTIVARLTAGALGVPFFPVNSLTGSDLAEQAWVERVTSPFGGETTTVVAAMQPDIMLVHAVAGDEDGNLILSPPYGEAAWGALASRRGVVATVEAILPRERMRQYQALVSIPAHTVRAVCLAPMGAHPYGLYSPIPEVPGYLEDEPHVMSQRAACASDDRHREWVAEWVLGTANHDAYLVRLGSSRVAELIGGAAPNAWQYVPQPADVTRPATSTETMIVEAARLVLAKLRSGRFEVLMTGIGFANLAAWLAHELAQEIGAPPFLMAEIGAYGYEPQRGDPFIFSHRNLTTCRWMTDVTAVLGGIIAGDHGNCLAIVGAGNTDQFGNVNSSRTNTGGYLVGSGGANDIASGAEEIIVVVKHGRNRLIERVPFVTSPGARVSTIVTDRGVLQRDTDTGCFVLTRVIVGEGTLAHAVAAAVEGCGWPLQVAPDVCAVEPPGSSDVERVRGYDPRSVFLGGT